MGSSPIAIRCEGDSSMHGHMHRDADIMHCATSLAVYAQPELHELSEEWLAAETRDVLKLIQQHGSLDPGGTGTAPSRNPAA